MPIVRRNMARRVAALAEAREGLASLVRLTGQASGEVQKNLLEGTLQGLEGRRSVEMPVGWSAAYAKMKNSPQPAVRELALELALIFDDPLALDAIRIEAADAKADTDVRNRAIQALVAKKASGLAPLLKGLVDDPATRRAALRGLAECDDPEIPAVILTDYRAFEPVARQDAVQTLASRPAWALALMDAVESNVVPRADLTAFTARQMLNLGNERLSARVNALWGEVRETAADKARLISDYRKRLTPESLARADRTAGRVQFQEACANCHKLFDAGGTIGPDITGAQRQNLDYLLENLVDPSGAVVRDYQMQIIESTSGRVITGLVVAESKQAVTIQTVNEKVVVPADEIESRVTSSVSMMPDGLLQKLSLEQVRDLVAYVAGPTQVPLPAPAEKPAGGANR
jgi:putative heme-binding domain-containing protein